jgi:signal transduction histidine kinase
MNIRSQLSILFIGLVSVILVIFAGLVYYSAAKSREHEFFKSLEKEALTKANLVLDVQMSAGTLQRIYRNNRSTLSEVEVAIYDTAYTLLYHDAVDIDMVKETRGMIDSIISQRIIRFYNGQYQGIGMALTYEGRCYAVTAAAYDEYGYNKLATLRWSMLFFALCSLVSVAAAGWLFAKKALSPVSAMTHTVQAISATNMGLRLRYDNRNDELSELADTFNQLLDRLQHSFEAQKHVVSNISHELRTPLTSVFAELQLALDRERTIAEYQRSITQATNDVQRLIKLTNSLLDLAKASYDESEIAFTMVRLDELLIEARARVLASSQHEYTVHLIVECEIENDTFLTVRGNEYLLSVAFVNLMENGCKFSPNKQSNVALTYNNTSVIIRFSDIGVGIPPEELSLLFTTFYRGSNKKYADGNGIGLSLTKRIITLHGGSISVVSEQYMGTTFTVELPHLHNTSQSSTMNTNSYH